MLRVDDADPGEGELSDEGGTARIARFSRRDLSMNDFNSRSHSHWACFTATKNSSSGVSAGADTENAGLAVADNSVRLETWLEYSTKHLTVSASAH